MQNRTDSSSKSLKPPAKRVAINEEIDLQFPTFEGLVTKISSNLSTTGMFIQSSTPVEVGTEFSFRFRIEEWSPIQGEARVIWARQESESPERPAGMGVEFTQLDAQSRRMIRWLVDKHRQEGGTPFDLGHLPAGASRTGPSLATQRASSLASSSRSKTSAKPLILIWATIILAVGVAAFFWWQGRVQLSPRGRDRTGVVEPATSPPNQTSSVTEDSAEPPSSTASISASDPAGALQLVEEWAAAWENRRADDLLALYAEEFEPPNELGREQWESAIRAKLDDPGFILVAVSGLDVAFPEIDRAVATFYRSIRSEADNETGRIQLDLVARDGAWLIVGEQSLD